VAPELFRAIKVVVDTDPRSGRFLLTGSTRVLVLSSGHTQRAIGTPKLAYVDSGLACHLPGKTPNGSARLRALPIDVLWRAGP